MLRSIGVDINNEDHYIAQWQALFDSDPTVQNDSLLHQSAVDQLPIARHEHTLAVKLNVGHWIRQKLVGRSDGRQTPLGYVQENIDNGSVLDESQFGLALAVLEKLEDYTTLGDLLLFHSKSHDPQLLRAIAVTTSHFLDVLQACGTADMVFIQLMQQHIVLHSKPGYLALVEALNDLAASLPNRARETRTLRKEKQKHDSKSLVTACSPISEHMAEALQIEHSGSALPCIDDIEQLLASGTSMDKQLLTDVFGVIWKRFEIARAESVQSGFTAAGLLIRLRSFDATAVAEMTIRRVDEALESRSRTAHHSMWISLVCAKVITFEKVMNRILQASQQVDNLIVQSKLLAELVECLTLGRPRADSSITHVRCEILCVKHLILTYLVALLPVLCAATAFLEGCSALGCVFAAGLAQVGSQHPGRYTIEYMQTPTRTFIHGPVANTLEHELARHKCLQRDLQPCSYDGRSSADSG